MRRPVLSFDGCLRRYLSVHISHLLEDFTGSIRESEEMVFTPRIPISRERKGFIIHGTDLNMHYS